MSTTTADELRDRIKAGTALIEQYIQLGKLLIEDGADHYDEAFDLFEEALKRARNEQDSAAEISVLEQYAHELYQANRYEDAEVQVRAWLKLDPKNASGWNDLGRALLEQGSERYEDALQAFSMSAELFKGAGDAINEKIALGNEGQTLRRLKRYSEAVAKLEAALRIDRDYAYAEWQLALTYRDWPGEISKSFPHFERYAELNRAGTPELYAGSLELWADALMTAQRYQDAEKKYQEAIVHNETSGYLHYNLGRALQSQGPERYVEAADAFKKAAERYSGRDAATSLAARGDMMRLLERYDEAEEQLRAALAIFEDAYSRNILGLVLEAKGEQYWDEAEAQYAKAAELWAESDPAQRKYALQNWSWLCNTREDYEGAIEKISDALQREPDDALLHYELGNHLASAARYTEALKSYERSIARDPTNPYPYHNTAHYLSVLGMYEKSYEAWVGARGAYKLMLDTPEERSVNIDQQAYYAGILNEVFNDREAAEASYRETLKRSPEHVAATSGLATLYHQWANSDKPAATALGNHSSAARRATQLLKTRFAKFPTFQNALDLGSFYLDLERYADASHWLEQARGLAGDSLGRQAQAALRQGVLSARRERYTEAIEFFQEALRVHPEDLKARANLGEAYLKAKQFDRAEDEFQRVLRHAPGNIEALIGCAQLCIDRAESGDTDRYHAAEEKLTAAIEHGHHARSGSKQLMGKELAQVYYLRAYARIKQYENAPQRNARLRALGRSDFEQCYEIDKNNYKARAALDRLQDKAVQDRQKRFIEIGGPALVTSFAAIVFGMTQIRFESMHSAAYGTMTFGSLIFMIAGLYLPKVLKLKVGAIELEKGAVEQISAPTSLGISR